MKLNSEEVAKRIIESNPTNVEADEGAIKVYELLKKAIEAEELSYRQLNQAVILLDNSFYHNLLTREVRL